MKSTVIFVLLLFPCISLAQEKLNINKNDISVESGIWNRGILGLSYSRYFNIKEKAFLSATAGYGVGVAFDGANHYVTANFSANFGKNRAFFCMGIEGKYFSIQEDYLHSFSADVPLEGVTASPMLGLKVFSKDKESIYKFRISSIPIISGSEINGIYPSIGGSIGFSI